jgi:hypothetical protein
MTPKHWEMVEVARRIVAEGDLSHSSLAVQLSEALIAATAALPEPANPPACRRTVAGCCAPKHCGEFGSCALGRAA